MVDEDALAMFDGLQLGEALSNPFEQIMSYLVSGIRAGHIPTGTRLPPERELSEVLQVSRVTLRSIIRALQQAGYVTTARGRSGGSVVSWRGEDAVHETSRLSPAMKARLLDQLVFRSVVEPGTAALAASRELNRDERTALRARLKAVHDAGANARSADAELHLYIASLSGSAALTDAVAQLQLLLNEPLTQTLPMFGTAMGHSNEQHTQIVDAILAGDGASAAEFMRVHVEATSELIRGFI